MTDPDTADADRFSIAGADPRSLAWSGAFWRGHRAFAAVLAFSVIGGALLAPYTYGFGSIWALFSVGVQLLAVWGAVVAANAMASVDVATALVREIDVRGMEYLVDLKSQRRTHVEIDRLEEALAPNNPTIPVPAPIRLLQHVCKEAHDRRFGSSIEIVQPYKEEALEDIFRLQNIQKIALWLGILGTFIGLLIGLKAMQDSDLASAAGFFEQVRLVLNGLLISFSASVAGLEVAIVLGFVILLLRRQHERYFACMESASVTVLSVARHSINRDDFLAEFGQVNTAVRDLTDRVYTQTREIASRLDQVHSRIQAQNERVADGLDTLRGAGADFAGFLTEARASQHAFMQDLGTSERQFVVDLHRLYDTLSVPRFSEAIDEGVRKVGVEVAQRLADTNGRTSTQMAGVERALEQLVVAVQGQSSDFRNAASTLVERMERSAAETARAVAGATEHLEVEMSRIGVGMSGAATQFDRLSNRIGELTRTLQRPSVAPLPKRRLWDRLASIVVVRRGDRAP